MASSLRRNYFDVITNGEFFTVVCTLPPAPFAALGTLSGSRF